MSTFVYITSIVVSSSVKSKNGVEQSQKNNRIYRLNRYQRARPAEHWENGQKWLLHSQLGEGISPQSERTTCLG